MKNRKLLLVACIATIIGFAPELPAAAEEMASAKSAILQLTPLPPPAQSDSDIEEDPGISNDIADPFYYFNLVNFHFNDKLYFWIIEPAASGYKQATPEIIRIGLGNAFSNLRAPVNFINNLFQLKFDLFGQELFRFVFNSVVGVGGFYDASYHLLNIDKQESDFGQTLGYYGVGHGPYVVWPLLGPSSLRDTIGYAGDQLMSPSTYLGYFYLDPWQSASIMTVDKVNDTSFKLGNYELIINSAIDDPYITLRDAYVQHRAEKIKQAQER